MVNINCSCEVPCSRSNLAVTELIVIFEAADAVFCRYVVRISTWLPHADTGILRTFEKVSIA